MAPCKPMLPSQPDPRHCLKQDHSPISLFSVFHRYLSSRVDARSLLLCLLSGSDRINTSHLVSPADAVVRLSEPHRQPMVRALLLTPRWDAFVQTTYVIRVYLMLPFGIGPSAMSLSDHQLHNIDYPNIGPSPSRPLPEEPQPPLPTSPGCQDICISCLECSAVVTVSSHKRHHTARSRVVGMDAGQYRSEVAQGREFDWSLLEWECCRCPSKWSSYVFFSEVLDGRFADPVDNPAALLERRSSSAPQTYLPIPPATFHALNNMSLGAANQIPGNNSSVPTLTLSQEGGDEDFWMASGDYPAGFSQAIQQAEDIWPQSPSSATSTPTMLDTLFPDRAVIGVHQGPPWLTDPVSSIHRSASQTRSAPDPSTYHSDSDPSPRSRRDIQIPTATRTIRARPSEDAHTITANTISAYHSRGPNFDIDNYAEVRRLGACEYCRARKGRCSPTHRQP